jgi:zinc transport system substrate-binding protein
MIMKSRYLYLYIALVAILFATSCNGAKDNDPRPTIYVSIAPLKPLIEGITGDDFRIEVLVPAGASPETFEPTPKQVIALNSSRFIFGTGLLDFERALLGRIENREQIVNLDKGISPIAGTCSHTHHSSHCHHGIDPHVWCSPKQLMTMAENAYEAIATAMPDSVKYETAYTALCNELLALDEEVTEMCRLSPHSYFIIYHPALTYLARDYGLEQISIEHEGKEPSVKRLAGIITGARNVQTKRIFYQSTYPRSTVEVIAEDIGAEPVEIDPLREDIFTNIEEITHLITE